MRKTCLALAVSAIATSPTVAQTPPEVVEVVGQTPLGGSGVPGDRIASNVQQASGDDLRAQRAIDLADFLRRNLASVFVNEAQNNPLQPDVQYRGFVGSPLLGLPQGLAVYQDGVRINEPFGDTVNWALIPESAIDTVYLMPGSNPLFGLNALGGAIAIRTKDGFSSPGTSAEVYGGSFGRAGVSAETGGSTSDRFGYYVTGAYIEEDGWRDFSPTEATQLFGRLSWQSDATSVGLAATLTETDLIGNGAAPVELLEIDRKAIFTRPDRTENDLTLLNLTAEHEVSDALTLSGNVYVRGSDIATLNGDESDYEECEDTPGFLCVEDDGEETLVFDASGAPITAEDELEGAAVNRTTTEQNGVGLGLQASWTGALGGRDNFFVVGLAYDESDIDFAASTELGALDATRLAVPGGVFLGDAFTRLAVETSNVGLYLANTLTFGEDVSLTLSGRYNDTRVALFDQLGTALDGNHGFHRFNPAIGVTAAVSEGMTFYAGYNESNRAPSPVELTCADEDDPCRLPNAFLADPPLEQVVAKTFEAGVRGSADRLDWHVGVFSTTNEDDILFISAGALTNEGFFDNVGKTRRDGIELSVDGRNDILSWFANYTYLDARFGESLALLAPNNPVAVDGEVFVTAGDRLPLVPSQLLKGGARISVGGRFTFGGEILAGSDFHMRGDEGNDLGRVGDYAVLNLRGEYVVSDNLRVFLDVDNVLDEDYETFGLFGDADEVLGDAFEDRRFLSPAAPRAAWIGVRIDF